MAEPPGGIEQSLNTTISIHEYIILGCTSGQPGQTELLGILSTLYYLMLYPLHLALCTSLKY